ncbi:putative two-component system sensor kinase [Patulibacter medicamentivorans]|uniref:Putative two-component system sensor kinase n=1 Tax=Patulibacter medicamentivorans TaxID=1097667 RepID=H0E6T8_9ACTN|nr:putative two-component system sensor kinase [Patulibacter medicamentivorans]
MAVLLLALAPLLVLLSAHGGYGQRRDDVLDVACGALLVATAILVFAGVRRLAVARRSEAGDTPWRAFVGRDRAVGGRRPAGVGHVASGLALLSIALIRLGDQAIGYRSGVPAVAGALLPPVLAAVVTVVVAPALAAVALVGRRDRGERERALQRQAVAAHLHDSVLQTFALVQRRLDDPDEVRRLIRRQERELRDWLAGREPVRAGTLAGALQQIADEVEAELGPAIELEMLGDRPTDERLGQLLDATREALRNAARHARGAAIRVVCDAEGPTIAVYVRDEGPGFAIDAVPPERRGIRDAIIARMEAAGGSAVIDTAPGAGTEVVLRLPAAGADR